MEDAIYWLGRLALIGLGIWLIFYFEEIKSARKIERAELWKFYFKNSDKFKKLVSETGNLSLENKKQLDKIFRDLSKDVEEQKLIKHKIDIDILNEKRKEANVNKRNYFGYQYNQIISHIWAYRKPLTVEVIQQIITKFHSSEKSEEIFRVLIDNQLIRKTNEKFEVSIEEIFHPFEIDQNGNTKVIFSKKNINLQYAELM